MSRLDRLTYYEKYLPLVDSKGTRKQKAADELMLRQGCLLVKTNAKRDFYWELQNQHKTFSRDIERAFGRIFTELEERASGQAAPAESPMEIDGSCPAGVFGDRFTWSWE